MYITGYEHYNFNTWFNNLFGNIILFIPLGFIALLFNENRVYQTFRLIHTNCYCHNRSFTNASACCSFDIDE